MLMRAIPLAKLLSVTRYGKFPLLNTCVPYTARTRVTGIIDRNVLFIILNKSNSTRDTAPRCLVQYARVKTFNR